jgi:hypothetical protein
LEAKLSAPVPRPRPGLLIFAAALAFALLSARNYAGSWNDGSRLAAIESLADHHTFVIERSIFVQVPQAPGASPYGNNGLLNRFGTRDVVRINGRIYSSKPPVQSLLMAAMYGGLKMAFGLDARRNPRLFCYLMTVLTSGLAYAIAVWCTFRIGLYTGLGSRQSLLLAGGVALTTVAVAWMQAVNNHIVLLAVTSAVVLNMLRYLAGSGSAGSIAAIGALSGFAYAIEQGSGMVLLGAAAVWTAYRTCNLRLIGCFVMAALPWVAAHHALIFALGHSVRPLNSVRAFDAFPGSAFSSGDMTGVLIERPLLKTVGYALGLLFGPRGFIGHNLALFLSLPAISVLIARGDEHLAELLFAGFYAGGTWVLYSLFSSNYSGVCCSIRWLVPLLAPAYYVLARFLKTQPEYWPDFLILSGWGLLFGAAMWWMGPWSPRSQLLCVPFQLLALASWAAYRWPRLQPGRIQSARHGTGPG